MLLNHFIYNNYWDRDYSLDPFKKVVCHTFKSAKILNGLYL